VEVAVSGVVLAVPFPVAVLVAVSLRSGSGIGETITVNVLGVALFPAASVALQVTTVLPTGNVLPGAGVQEAVPGPSTSSVVAGGE